MNLNQMMTKDVSVLATNYMYAEETGIQSSFFRRGCERVFTAGNKRGKKKQKTTTNKTNNGNT
jgi:hypothetical protein